MEPSLVPNPNAGDVERLMYVCPERGVVALYCLRERAVKVRQVVRALDMLEMDFPAHVVELDRVGRTKYVTRVRRAPSAAKARWLMEPTTS